VDLLDPSLHGAAWHARADALRDAHGAVVRRGEQVWVLGYEVARAVLEDPGRFTSWHGTRPGMRRAEEEPRTLHNLDPPAHCELRAAVAPLFATTAARGVVGALGERFEVVADVAVPMANGVLADLLGIDEAVARELGRRSAVVHDEGSPEAHGALFDLVDEVVSLDLALPDDVRRRVTRLLVQAGWATTVDAIAGAMVALDGRRVIATRAATEELLRVSSPIRQFARTATVSTQLGGVEVAAGEQVVVFFAAANRDGGVFRDPQRLDLRRRPNRHLAFGAGPHRCPGAHLARSRLSDVLAALAGRTVHVEEARARDAELLRYRMARVRTA